MRIKSKEDRKVYFKARKVILSCQNIKQLTTAMRYISLALKQEKICNSDAIRLIEEWKRKNREIYLFG